MTEEVALTSLNRTCGHSSDWPLLGVLRTGRTDRQMSTELNGIHYGMPTRSESLFRQGEWRHFEKWEPTNKCMWVRVRRKGWPLYLKSISGQFCWVKMINHFTRLKKYFSSSSQSCQLPERRQGNTIFVPNYLGQSYQFSSINTIWITHNATSINNSDCLKDWSVLKCSRGRVTRTLSFEIRISFDPKSPSGPPVWSFVTSSS